jgi:SAM-dependent methyltransferase
MLYEIGRLTYAGPLPAALYEQGPAFSRREPVYVPSLLRLDGVVFIEAMYRALLGRKPDPSGMKIYLQTLSSGTSKAQIIQCVRESPEGIAYNSELIGLPPRSRLGRLYALPVIGRRLRALETGLYMRKPARATEALRHEISTLRVMGSEQKQVIAALQARLAETPTQGQLEAATAPIKNLEQAVRQFRTAPWSEPIQRLEDRQRAAEVQTETLGLDLKNRGKLLAGDVADLKHRLSALLETVQRRTEAFDATARAEAAVQQEHLLDSLYVAFEAKFRGSRELIKARQRVHVPVMIAANAGSAERPIVDVGAGRGEWLELLREQGLEARGIDLNIAMVKSCEALGLDCIFGDAVEELGRLADDSLGAVTGFHIIEHLPFHTMVALFDEALRALAPGGVVLFETPNPANLQVGSRWFYLDPTHRNPLPAEMVSMIAEARGFVDIRIVPLHPTGEHFEVEDARLGAQLDALLHGPMDYALIATKA